MMDPSGTDLGAPGGATPLYRPALSGAVPRVACPGCRHARGVQPLARVAAPPRGRPGKSALESYLELRALGRIPPAPAHPLLRGVRPPRPPRSAGEAADWWLVRVVNLGFAALVLLLAGRAIHAREIALAATLPGLGALGCGGWLGFAAGTGRLGESARRAAAAHRAAQARWVALYYCEDCGGVFHDGWAACLSLRQLPAYLAEGA